jgi:4'-phosphopantetheinyl transferase
MPIRDWEGGTASIYHAVRRLTLRQLKSEPFTQNRTPSLATPSTCTMTPEARHHHHEAQDLDLWCFYYQGILTNAATVAAYESLLTPVDSLRYRAFVFEEDRHAFLATRVLVRCVLSHYAPQPPETWRFELDSNGKPRLANIPLGGPLHFNLSNTRGLVVCGVSRHTERLGVDVEFIARTESLIDIASGHFADVEVAALHAQADAEKQEAFFRYWTLKESFTKATGRGLSTPLDQFAITLAPGHPAFTDNITIGFADNLAECSGHWRFAQWRVPGRYMVATGVDTGGSPLRCRLLRAAPLLPGHGDLMELEAP